MTEGRAVFSLWLLLKDSGGGSHIIDDGDAEGTALLTFTAADAILPAIGKPGIVGTNGSRDMLRIETGDIQIFIHCGNVDSGRTGLAMAAIDTISGKIIALGVHNMCVITFAVIHIQIPYSVRYFLARLAPKHYAGYGGSG